MKHDSLEPGKIENKQTMGNQGRGKKVGTKK